MFKNLSTEDLAIIAVILDEKQEKRKRIWVHDILKNRKSEGEFATLYKSLEDHEEKFFKYFRMGRNQFNMLLWTIKGDIQKQNSRFRKSISPREKLAVCLRFLATGDSYQTIAFSYRLGHSTVQSAMLEVCTAIIKNLQMQYLNVPKEDWENVAKEFWELWHFPNCIGAIDGKHVVIEAPPNTGSLFFNYKKTFSIVLLALVDAQYNFIAIDIGAYGKNSDGGIFSHSNLGKAFEHNKLNIPEGKNLPNTNNFMPLAIIGDEAFPLKSYLLRPYPGDQIVNDAEKKTYNDRLCRARKVVEDAVGQLTQKFRIYSRRLKALPQNADKIVMTTCILHNFIKRSATRAQLPPSSQTVNSCNITQIRRQGGSATREAFDTREKFKNFFFSRRSNLLE